MSDLAGFLNKTQKYYANTELVNLTAIQIAKDFEAIGETITYSGDYLGAYPELFDQLFPVIQYMTDRKFEKLLYLLYRVDLSEVEVRRLLADTTLNFVSEITHRIIEREFKKVLTRKFYSSKQSEAID